MTIDQLLDEFFTDPFRHFFDRNTVGTESPPHKDGSPAQLPPAKEVVKKPTCEGELHELQPTAYHNHEINWFNKNGVKMTGFRRFVHKACAKCGWEGNFEVLK